MKYEERSLRKYRNKLLEYLKDEVGITNPKILEAFDFVPRHLFVPRTFQRRSYDDDALPIGDAQTISKPSIIAVMLELAELKPNDIVLEIGSGSGYQTALLATMVKHVYSLERINALTSIAKSNLEKLGVENVSVKTFDGSYGWPDRAPFDVIIVCAAAPQAPETLVSQLNKKGGRMVCPIGDSKTQKLIIVRRNGTKITTEEMGNCRFVPLIGKYGWSA